MSADKSIKKNYIYSMVSQVLLLGSPFITIPYTSRVLNPETVGTASFVRSIANYFVLFATLGITRYACREVSYLQNDRSRRSQVFWNVKALTCITVSLNIAVFLVLAYIYARANFHLYVIASIEVITILFDVTWVYAGMESFGITVLKSMAVRVAQIIFLLTFIKSNADLPYYVGGSISMAMLGNVALWFLLPKYISRPKLKDIKPFNDFKVILQLFVPNIAIEIYTVLDKTMIGVFTGEPAENGYYEFCMKTVRMTITIVTAIAGVISPRIGFLFASKDMEQIYKYMYKSYSFMWMLGVPICIGLIGISDNFVPWFFGAGYFRVAGLIKAASLLMLATSFGNLTGAQYLIPTKRHNQFTKSVMIGAGVNFCLNLVLIPLFKAYGAVIASVIAEMSIAASQLYMIRHELKIRKIFALGKNNYIAGIIMLVFLVVIGKKLAPSVIHTFMMIFSGALVYFSVLLILRDEFFMENAKAVLASFRKKLHI